MNDPELETDLERVQWLQGGGKTERGRTQKCIS